MNNYFKAVVKFDKTGEDGSIKTVSQEHLVDAMSFTEAEKRITEEMQPFISGDFSVHSLKREKISELFDTDSPEADKWYSCKVMFVTLDENKGVEKKTANNMYIKASSVQEATEGLRIELKNTLADYEIAQVKETKILDVFKF